jgi:sulfur carrier protein ThiS adenylyltransferase
LLKIGIAGTGGIGSNVAMLLVRYGVNRLKLFDFDKIEQSNLNRQFYFYDQLNENKVEKLATNLTRINKNIKLEYKTLKITNKNIKTLFNDCDIIVEGFDKAEDKSMLINSFINSKKLIVPACGVAGVNIDNIKTKNIQKNIYIVGDFISDINNYKLYSTKVMIIASIMANIIIKHIEQNI